MLIIETMSNDKFYTVQEVSTLLQVHWQSVLNYIKKGDLEALKLGKGYRISQESLDKFVAHHTTTPKTEADS
jgi:excisionase family DNA binding protein